MFPLVKLVHLFKIPCLHEMANKYSLFSCIANEVYKFLSQTTGARQENLNCLLETQVIL